MDIKHTVYGILANLMHSSANGWVGKLQNPLTEPSLESVLKYLSNADPFIMSKFPAELVKAPSSYNMDEYPILSSYEFDVDEFKRRSYGSFVKEGGRFANFYIEPFVKYFRLGYKHLHVLPVFCLGNVDMLHDIVEDISAKYKVQYKKEFVRNSIFYRLTSVAKETTLYLFTTHMNMNNYLRTVETRPPPLNQLYVLTKTAISRDSLLEKFILDVFKEVVKMETRVYISSFVPYELFEFPFVKSQNMNDKRNQFKDRYTFQEITTQFINSEHRTILFGQCVNSKMTLAEFDFLLRHRRLPTCIIWRHITNVDVKNDNNVGKVCLVVTFNDGTLLAKYSIIYGEANLPKQLTDVNYLPKSILVEGILNYPNVLRIIPRVLYIESLSTTIITESPLWITDQIMNVEKYCKANQMTTPVNIIVDMLCDMFKLTFINRISLYTNNNVTIYKIIFNKLQIYTFASPSVATSFNLYEFLFNFINSINTVDVKNYSLLDDSLNLMNMLIVS